MNTNRTLLTATAMILIAVIAMLYATTSSPSSTSSMTMAQEVIPVDPTIPDAVGDTPDTDIKVGVNVTDQDVGELPPLDTITLTSTAGIVATTIALVWVLRRFLSDMSNTGSMPMMSKVPIALYAAVIASVLTLTANAIGLLEGSPGALLVQTVTSILTAFGAYDVLSGKALSPIGKSAIRYGNTTLPPPTSRLSLLLVGSTVYLAAMTSGCAAITPEAKVAERAQLYTATVTTLGKLHDAGIVSDELLVQQIDPLVKAGDLYLQQAYEALQGPAEERGTRVQESLKLLDRVLEQLEQRLQSPNSPHAPVRPAGDDDGPSSRYRIDRWRQTDGVVGSFADADLASARRCYQRAA